MLKSDQLLEYIAIIGYATPLNMTLFTRHTAKDTPNALQEVYRLLMKPQGLVTIGYVQPIPDKYGNTRYTADRFFKLSDKGEKHLKAISPLYQYKSLDPSIMWHDMAVIDFCTSLWMAYKDDYLVEFKREHFVDQRDIKAKTKTYKPDRVIVLTHKTTYEQKIFIYEHETGTRSTNEIWRLKIDPMIKSRHLIEQVYEEKSWWYLMTVSHIDLRADLRPWEFTDQMIESNQISFGFLKNMAREYNLSRLFIIRPFYQYPNIKEMNLGL